MRSFEFFNKAIEKDRNCALAYAGLAVSYSLLPIFAFFTPRDTFPSAREAALKALEIDDTLSEAHTSLAITKWLYDWDWKGAEEEHKRAIDLNPGSAGALRQYALYLSHLARHDEAVDMISEAVELSPLDPGLYHNKAMVSYYARRYDEATDQFETAIEMNPNRVHGHNWLGIAYLQKSRYEEAMAEFKQEQVVSKGQNPMAECFMGIAYAEMGKQVEARHMLEQLFNRTRERYVPPAIPAALCFALGEIDEGFEWVDKAYEARDYWLCYFKVEPRVDIVRSDPRYLALLKKIGLDK
jgi:tetratricopeptide (TPR) repeat protein